LSTIRLVTLCLFLVLPALARAQPAPEPAPVPSAADPATPPPSAEPPPPAPAPVPTPTVAPAPEPVPVKPSEERAKPAQLLVKPGGYLQTDARLFSDDSGTHDITIRRLRFKLDGTAYKYVNFRTLIDFAGSKLVVDDAWAELAVHPELVIRFGKDKAQFGLERLQSAANLMFIERSYPTQLSPNRDIGVAARGDILKGLIHYSAALVDGVADNAVIEGETDGNFESDVHVLVSPFKGTRYGDLAIGGAATFGRTEGTLSNTGLTAIKSDGQATIVKFAGGGASDDLAQTAHTDGFRKRFTAHGYYDGGPVGVLAEYVRDDEPVVLLGTHTVMTNQAWQLEASLAVTPGDKASYRGLKPRRVFDPFNGALGAFEVAARYGEIRIDPKAFDSGIVNAATSVRRARTYTLGGNWYVSEYVKLQINYSLTQYAGGAKTGNRETENLIAIRFQVSI
jgi:phosphate-selective porin OprO/OprP